jgi:hypothetical protein
MSPRNGLVASAALADLIRRRRNSLPFGCADPERYEELTLKRANRSRKLTAIGRSIAALERVLV